MATRRAKKAGRAQGQLDSNVACVSTVPEATVDKYREMSDDNRDKNDEKVDNKVVIGSHEKADQKSSRISPNEESRRVFETTNVAVSPTPQKCSSDKRESDQSHKKNKLFIKESDIKNDHDMQDGRKSNAKESSLINDAPDEDVLSNSSSGLFGSWPGFSRDLSNDTRDISQTPQKCSSDKRESDQSHKKNKLSIEESDIKNDHNMQDSRKSNAKESSLINDASDEDVLSDIFSGLASAQLKLNDESDEIPAHGGPTGEICLIQNLGRSKKYNTKNKDKKKMCTGTESGRAPLSHPIIDRIVMDTLKMNNRNCQQETKRSWGLKKNTHEKDDQYISDRFDPVSLPSGRVRDDDSCSGASCVSIDSILSELKLIEETAKLMYQKLILENSDKIGPNQNSVSAQFSPSLLETTTDARDGSNSKQPTYQEEEDNNAAGKTKKGGKFWKLIGRNTSTKKLRF
jgi:hypothetical protein